MRFYEIKDIGDVNIRGLLTLLRGGKNGFSVFSRFTREWRFVTAFLRSWKTLQKFDITTPQRIAHFIAQGIVETGGFRSFEENLKYTSVDRLLEIHGRHFKDRRDARSYVGKPKKIANRVYANRMGNGDEASGDGWKYRGRGVIQLTGKNNYEHFGKIIGENLVDKPDTLIKDFRQSIAVAAAFLKENDLLKYADDDDVAAVSRGINLGDPKHRRRANHEGDRLYWTRRVLALFENPDKILKGGGEDESGVLTIGSHGDDVRELQRSLAALGYNPGPVDGAFGQNTERAVVAFQREFALDITGVVNQAMADLIMEILADGPGGGRPGASFQDLKKAGVPDPRGWGQIGTGTLVAGAGAGSAASETGLGGVVGSDVDDADDGVGEDSQAGDGQGDDAPNPTADETPADAAAPPAEPGADDAVGDPGAPLEDTVPIDIPVAPSEPAATPRDEAPPVEPPAEPTAETTPEPPAEPAADEAPAPETPPQTPDISAPVRDAASVDEANAGAVGDDALDVAVPAPPAAPTSASAPPDAPSDAPSDAPADTPASRIDADAAEPQPGPDAPAVDAAPATVESAGENATGPTSDVGPAAQPPAVEPVDARTPAAQSDGSPSDCPCAPQSDAERDAIAEIVVADETGDNMFKDIAENFGIEWRLPPGDTTSARWDYDSLGLDGLIVLFGLFLIFRARARAQKRLSEYRFGGR